MNHPNLKKLILIFFTTITLIFIFWARFFYETFFILGILIVFTIPGIKTKQYIKDWLPFVVILLLYETMRGTIDELIKRVHITDIIELERALFGTVPTIVMQNALFKQSVTHWYDILFIAFYFSHFLFPFFTAFWIWIQQNTKRKLNTKKPLFRAYTFGFVGFTLLSLTTYYFFPVMPPWLASEQGYLPKISRLLFTFGNTLGLAPHTISFTANLIGSNPIAAMPSLHAAWSAFAALFLIIFYNKKMWPTVIIPIGIWIAIVYLGEHYVVDVIGGIIYACIGIGISWYIIKRQKNNTSKYEPKTHNSEQPQQTEL